jgi:hypothetical protein
MVHGLATLKRMNDEAAKRPARQYRMEKVPEHLHGNAAATRGFLNRPWTKEELSRKRSPFRGKDVL